MKILVIGSGGREHALVWKIAQSPKVDKIYCAPGNAGIRSLAECVKIAVDDIQGLLEFALHEKIDLTVVGPEAPLTFGVVDAFNQHGLKIFGPSRKAAALEGSKSLAKELMRNSGIPTAAYEVFDKKEAAMEYISRHGAPLVIKADGLAAGKGVIIAMTEAEARDAVANMLEEKAFGIAGEKIVIEEYMMGEEVSLLAFSDGEFVSAMLPVQDHKRVGDGDTGPNTGGMGTYAPAPVFTQEMGEWVKAHILQPTVNAMRKQNQAYKGVLYVGLMLTPQGIRVLEYNARFGDPETQVLMALLETDLVDIMEAVVRGNLADLAITWKKEAAVCVIMAAAGYPGSYPKGDPITGLDEAAKEAVVFHAGTAQKDDGIVTAGGRVLGVTAVAEDFEAAQKKAYAACGKIHWEGAFYRHDIADKALKK